MSIITYYCKLNQQLVRNQYPPLIIVKIIHKMYGFQYVTVLDINMG